MKKSLLKYYIGILLILFIDVLHNIFFHNNDKFDVYLFYEHKRYLTNILYDISGMFKFTVLTYWLRFISKEIFTPLFIVSILIWVLYFLFYNQEVSIVIIPIYVLLAYLYNKTKFIK